jgi:hypothetical protein
MVAGYIYWMLCKHMGLQVTDNYCEHIHVKVINVSGTTVVWYVPIIRDYTILAN